MLIIKGDMPSICKQCKSQGGLTDGSFNYICCDDNYLDFYCDGSKPNECQILCEIPDKHYRLINADTLADQYMKYLMTCFPAMQVSTVNELVNAVKEAVKIAPVVVEATE